MNFKQNMCRVSLCVAVVLISTSLMVHCDTLIEGEMCPGSVFKCISEEEMNSERMRRRCWIR